LLPVEIGRWGALWFLILPLFITATVLILFNWFVMSLPAWWWIPQATEGIKPPCHQHPLQHFCLAASWNWKVRCPLVFKFPPFHHCYRY
jgi:hypothetical protein